MEKKGKVDKGISRVFWTALIIGIFLGLFLGMFLGYKSASKDFMTGFSNIKVDKFQFAMDQNELNSFIENIQFCSINNNVLDYQKDYLKDNKNNSFVYPFIN